MKAKPTLFIVAFFSLASTFLFAQTPVSIDVTSLTFTIRGDQPSGAAFVMEATGLPAAFPSPVSGLGEALFAPIEGCTACRLGDSFPTNFSNFFPQPSAPNWVHQYYPGGVAGNKVVRLTLIGTSADIVLYPTLSRKKSPSVLKGPAHIKGRVELSISGIVVAVDDDVDLSGSFKVEFSQYLKDVCCMGDTRRGFDYKSISFSYSQ